MTTLRSRLRLWATAWLVFQAASLAALAPGACCATARTADAERDRQAPASGVHCPMPAADGSACPMHRARSADEEGTADARLTACGCEASSLFTLIATPGILTDGPSPVFLVAARARPSLPSDDPFDSFRRPDPRPPRA